MTSPPPGEFPPGPESAEHGAQPLPQWSAAPQPEPVPWPETEEVGADSGGQEPPKSRWDSLREDPLTVLLALIIVAALAGGALLGGEFYARRKANSIVAQAVSCVARDGATASFGMRPFLIQHFTHSYRDIRVETAGNQFREAKGMRVTLHLDDIRLNKTAESAGTMGALDAEIDWPTDGIQQTVQDMTPLVGGLISGVVTDPDAGTVRINGPLGAVTVKPTVADGVLALDAVNVTAIGMTLPSESAQFMLDGITAKLTGNLPMGIRAESVEVTDTGIKARFAARNATIPNGAQDPCFAGL